MVALQISCSTLAKIPFANKRASAPFRGDSHCPPYEQRRQAIGVYSAAAVFGSKALDSNLTCAQHHSYTNKMTGDETHDIFGAA
jgi:hypothetical protein